MKHLDAAVISKPPSPEARLVRQAIAGDADAFAALYDTHVDAIYRFIFFRVGDEATAEDLTSHVFLRAWENLYRYQMRGPPFGAWLFRIARNTLVDYYRQHRETEPLDAHTQMASASTPDLEARAEERLEADRLRAALQCLTDDQRQVLTLKFIEGLSTEEISKIMRKRQGAIRALQMRGLQALRELIKARNE